MMNLKNDENLNYAVIVITSKYADVDVDVDVDALIISAIVMERKVCTREYEK